MINKVICNKMINYTIMIKQCMIKENNGLKLYNNLTSVKAMQNMGLILYEKILAIHN